MEINLQKIENKELIVTLDNLVIKENATTLQILTYLNELERGKLYLELGYNSLWSYMTRKLHYSDPGASRRIKAARCINEHVEVYELVKSRALSLSALCIVSGILTKENKGDLLSRVAGKPYKEIERIVSTFKPRGEVRDTVKPISIEVSLPAEKKTLNPIEAHLPKQEFTFNAQIESAPPIIVLEKVKFTFQASTEFSKKFQKVRSLLSGKYPMGGTFEEIFDEALNTYLRVHDPEKRAERRAKRKLLKEFKDNEGRRNIPSPLKDLILVRDKRCTFENPDGTRCNSTWDLEVHHIKPWGKGGKASTGNLKVLCRAHNLHQAENSFGKVFMRKALA